MTGIKRSGKSFNEVFAGHVTKKKISIGRIKDGLEGVDISSISIKDLEFMLEKFMVMINAKNQVSFKKLKGGMREFIEDTDGFEYKKYKDMFTKSGTSGLNKSLNASFRSNDSFSRTSSIKGGLTKTTKKGDLEKKRLQRKIK